MGHPRYGHQVEQPSPWPQRGQAAQASAPGSGLAAGRAGDGLVKLASLWAWAAFAVRLSLEGVEVDRAIRTGKLHALPRFHIRPIDVVVCHGSDSETWF